MRVETDGLSQRMMRLMFDQINNRPGRIPFVGEVPVKISLLQRDSSSHGRLSLVPGMSVEVKVKD